MGRRLSATLYTHHLQAGLFLRDRFMLRRTLNVGLAAATLTFFATAPALATPTSNDPSKAPAGNYELDPRHAGLVVKVAHLGGFSRFTMRFNALTGGFTYDPANWQATKVNISIDPKSIDTEIPTFNKQVAGFFEPDKYPAITFVTTSATGSEGKGTVTGDLTFHGVTKPVVLKTSFNASGVNPLDKGTTVGFNATTSIKRSDFGVKTYVPLIGDDVTLRISAAFERKN
jgi:polyisoprenoid-binding protein YceI